MGKEQQSAGQPEVVVFGMTRDEIEAMHKMVLEEQARADLVLLGPSSPDANFEEAFQKGSQMLAEDPVARNIFRKIMEDQ